ncbi:tRNA (adenosine(37)-N6)-dimethylallyltransferase MiaA [Pareuzebyella sediminis]|uniref:tRNA (adenosine(37)-N6)-dimethylallyltransferase MiaA n=1 Tax=Pareuzebyella sediminis TaxID=2607998 RepID=UPI0011EBB0DA|nr:tRNA (adenosine(37)-N6)-dimethylallyltransferase MiaA [Pareuzebyella sediminis]
MEKTLVSVVGPTAIGKTKLAIVLARHFDTDVISADSRQFYKEMNIGTAVPSAEELSLAQHHFIQHKSIFDHYSVGAYEKDAISMLHKLFKAKDLVVMVGGSGLYIDAVAKGLDEFPEVPPHFRKNLNKKLEKDGLESLQKMLHELDPVYYAKVDLENPHRLIRALEICLASEKPYSSFLSYDKKKRAFQTVTIGLNTERSILYDRINKRVDKMVDRGLLAEVESLKNFKGLNALQTVGYKELFAYFDGNCTLDFALGEVKKNTRRFAKRQLTWFKRNQETLWVTPSMNEERIILKLEKDLIGKK